MMAPTSRVINVLVQLAIRIARHLRRSVPLIGQSLPRGPMGRGPGVVGKGRSDERTL